jgi:hypothetical protein
MIIDTVWIRRPPAGRQIEYEAVRPRALLSVYIKIECNKTDAMVGAFLSNAIVLLLQKLRSWADKVGVVGEPRVRERLVNSNNIHTGPVFEFKAHHVEVTPWIVLPAAQRRDCEIWARPTPGADRPSFCRLLADRLGRIDF